MKQRKSVRFLALLTALMMTVSMTPFALAAEESTGEASAETTSDAAEGTTAGEASQPGIGNFKKTRDYEAFGDVDENAWYFTDLRGAYEMGLISGGNGKMNPTGNLTLAEAITLGCNVFHIYTADDYTPGGDPWYQNAIEYAKKNYIIPSDGYSDYTAAATRAVVARIFANSIFPAELARINRVAWIPDVNESTPYRTQIYALYNAGVLAGGSDGSFRPGDKITRAETAAIMNRLVDPEKRVKFSLTDSHAPGTAAESKDGAVRVYYNADAGWSVTPGEYKENESDSMTISHKDGAARLEVGVRSKSASDTDLQGLAAAAAQQIKAQGITLDSDPYSAWIHGMSGYTFEYQFKQEDGSTGNGEFCCVENSNCYVYMWITYLDSRTDEVDAQMWNIYNSIDVSL